MSNESSKDSNEQVNHGASEFSMGYGSGSVSVKSDKTTIRMAIGLTAVCVLGWIFKEPLGDLIKSGGGSSS